MVLMLRPNGKTQLLMIIHRPRCEQFVSFLFFERRFRLEGIFNRKTYRKRKVKDERGTGRESKKERGKKVVIGHTVVFFKYEF